MCNAYGPPSPLMVAQYFDVLTPHDRYRLGIGPWGVGPFVRLRDGQREVGVGQWALIGDRDTRANCKPRMTNNARFEELTDKPTYRGPWARGQRCLIPAEWYQEPCWEGGKHVAWHFRRADREPWGLAGMWNDWTDPATGEVVSSYTMLTLNCDEHPLLARMHKPDPTKEPHLQDKRTVVPLERGDWEAWLRGTVEEAARLVRVPAVEIYDAGPAQRVAEGALL